MVGAAWSAGTPGQRQPDFLTLINSPIQNPPQYHTERSSMAPSNAGMTHRNENRQNASPTKMAGRKYWNPVWMSGGEEVGSDTSTTCQ